MLTIIVPFRAFILERFFEDIHLRYLDPSNESDEVYHEEQKEIRKAFRSTSFDSEENEFPHFGEFRGQGKDWAAAILTKRSLRKASSGALVETSSNPDLEMRKQQHEDIF